MQTKNVLKIIAIGLILMSAIWIGFDFYYIIQDILFYYPGEQSMFSEIILFITRMGDMIIDFSVLLAGIYLLRLKG